VWCLRVLRAVDSFMGNISDIQVSHTNVTHVFKFAIREHWMFWDSFQRKQILRVI